LFAGPAKTRRDSVPLKDKRDKTSFFINFGFQQGYAKRKTVHMHICLHCKVGSKPLDLVRNQGAIRLKSGAYTLVREHFEPNRNADIRQEMTV
jgi:hypothetical protein